MRPRLQEVEIPQGLRRMLEPNARAFRFGECLVIVSRSADGWHLSISHPHRYPTWDEIKAARYALTPHNVTMALILPPPEEYVNVHENCFHDLWCGPCARRAADRPWKRIPNPGVLPNWAFEAVCPVCRRPVTLAPWRALSKSESMYFHASLCWWEQYVIKREFSLREL